MSLELYKVTPPYTFYLYNVLMYSHEKNVVGYLFMIYIREERHYVYTTIDLKLM